jgi:glycosyltransferase involved in cell wall biosynthesis
MPGVSVVIPCLNEKAAITEVVGEVRTTSNLDHRASV